MEVYVALYDYEKERDDILSFSEGDKFWIVSKTDKRWWAAYAITPGGGRGEYGYIPSSYLQRFLDPSAGELAQELSETSAGEQKRVTLQELKEKVPRKPPAAMNTDESEPDEVVIIKPLKTLAQPPEDCPQVEPKRLPNPYKDSKVHLQLHRELKLENARGGIKNLGKPELEVVMQRRSRLDAEGKPGPIKPKQASSKTPAATGELASQLARRTMLLEEAEKQELTVQNEPEFMKVSLRKTH